ncbi:MAG: hypothetical protein ACREN4_04225 [Candidatus Dormibacteria bacterium]
MAKLLYVEPHDGITDLVDRIRRAEQDRDLVFVVPPDSHVLRTPLDLRLLMQYTKGFQKRIAIVSGDPQVQALSIRTGFPTFASLALLEQGAPLRGVPAPAAAAPVEEAVATPRAGRPVAPTPPEPRTRELARRGPTQLVATGAGLGAGWWGRFRGWWQTARGRNTTVATGAGVVVLLILLLLFVFPSATVTVGVEAHRITDEVTIQGSLGSQGGGTLDQISTQALQTSNATQTFTITPSGTQALPPVPATGSIQLCLTGPGSGGTLTFSQAPEFKDQSDSQVFFTATSSGLNGSYTVPPCGGPSAGTVSIPVQADLAATTDGQGNVGPTSWTWTNSTSSGCYDIGGGCTQIPSGRWTAASGAAMTGGAPATTQSVFSTTDVTTAQQQLQTIDSNLTQKVDRELRRAAGKQTIAEDSSGNGIQINVNNPTLPTGCNTSSPTACPAGSNQTLTVTVSASATAYSPTSVRAAVIRDLKSKIPSDAELLANSQIGTPHVVSAGAGGALTIADHAVGYWAPRINLKPYQGKLAFMSAGSARSYLLAQLPGASSVTIKQSPIGLPWLPIISSNIHLERVSLAQGRRTA